MVGNRAASNLLARAAQPAGPRHLLRQPTLKPDPVAEKRAKLDALVKAKKWQPLATELAAFSDTEMPAWIPQFPGSGFAEFMTFLLNHHSPGNDRVFARATFASFQREHPQVSPSENVVIFKPGTASRPLSVPGGTVTVRTGVVHALKQGLGDPEERKELGYSVTYKGADSERSRWIQLVWFEAIALYPGGPAEGKALSFDVPAAAMPMRSTTDHGDQHVIVDAQGETPFYEDHGANNRTADSTTIFDAPTSQSSGFTDVFDGPSPPARVTATAHMIQYLVRDDQVLCRVNLEVRWVFSDRKVPTPTFSEPRLRAVTHLNPEHHRTLAAQFPGFTWIP